MAVADQTVVISYEQDLTGASPANRIVREPHPVSEITTQVNDCLVLDFPPYFPKDFLIEVLDENGEYSPLVEKTDFEHRYPWYSLYQETGVLVYGGTKINKKPNMPMLYVTYQTFGGHFTGNRKAVLENLANYVYNPRICTWDQITNVQETFPPNQHVQDMETLVRWDKVEEQVAKLIDQLGIPVDPTLLYQQQVVDILASNNALAHRVAELESKVFDLTGRTTILERRL